MHRQPRTFYLLQRAYYALFRACDRTLRSNLGVSATQQAILFLLTRNGAEPISELADKLQISKSSISGQIDRLEQAGMVRREQSPCDARSFHLIIEEKGRQVVTITTPNIKRINAELLDPFTNQERATIERFLNHVADHATSIVVSEARRTFKARENQ